ncbi:MAG TPA: hypothetical protein VMS18_03050 [Candidatus Binatia bacterium]|nr:hypothetical protein [Candidatus Binatia bacterium]
MAVSGILAELFSDLNSCSYLFLREAGETIEFSLRLMIEEGVALPEATPIEVCGVSLGSGHNVTSGENTRLFEVCWDSYVAYSVTNESFANGVDETDKFELGNLVRVYSKSNFLEYVRKATLASDEYPGPLQHIGIICEWHVIDVISTSLPTVKKLRSAHRD